MNWVDIFLIFLLVLLGIIGFRKGLIKSLYDILTIAVSLIFSMFFSLKCALLLYNFTPVGEFILKMLSKPGSNFHKILKLPEASMGMSLQNPLISSYVEGNAVIRRMAEYTKVYGTDASFGEALSIIFLFALISTIVLFLSLFLLLKVGPLVVEKLNRIIENSKAKDAFKAINGIGGATFNVLAYILALFILLNNVLIIQGDSFLEKGLNNSKTCAFLEQNDNNIPSDITSTESHQQPKVTSLTKPSPKGEQSKSTIGEQQTTTSSMPSVKPSDKPSVAEHIEGYGEYLPLNVPLEEIIPVIGKEALIVSDNLSRDTYDVFVEISPSKNDQKFITKGVSITIPQMTAPDYPITLVAKKEPRPQVAISSSSDVNIASAYTVTLGNIINLPEPIDIEIPYNGSGDVGALYLNSRNLSWQQVPYIKKDNSIVIRTNHLSTFAVTETPSDYYFSPEAKTYFWYPSSNVTYDIRDIEKILSDSTEKSAMLYGWEAAKTWYDIGSLTGSVINDVIYEVPGLSTINTVVGKMGLGFSSLQIISDVACGKSKAAGPTAYETALGLAISKFGIQGMQIGFIGVSIMNQAIVTFAKEAISGKEKIYEDAYQLYYSRNSGISTNIKVRNAVDWFNSFYEIITASSNSTDATERIKRDINTYVNAFWGDTNGRVQAFAYITQRNSKSQSFGFDAGINEGLKKRINDSYKSHLDEYLNNILVRVMLKIENEQKERFQKEEMAVVAEELNKRYALGVNVTGPKGEIGGLKFRFDAPVNGREWKGVTNSYGQISFTFTLLGYLRAGMPKKIILTDKEGKDYEAEFDLENLSANFNITSAPSSVSINPEKTEFTVGDRIKLNPTFKGDAVSPKSDVIWDVSGGIVDNGYFIPYFAEGNFKISAKMQKGDSTPSSVDITIKEDLLMQKINEHLNKHNFIRNDDIDYSKLLREVSPNGEVYFYLPKFYSNNILSADKSQKHGICVKFARKSAFENVSFLPLDHIILPYANFSVRYSTLASKKRADISLDLLSLSKAEWDDVVVESISQYKEKKLQGMQMTFYNAEPLPEAGYVLMLYRATPEHAQSMGQEYNMVSHMWRARTEPMTAAVLNYKDGVRHGTFTTYWPNGILSESAVYNEGTLQGFVEIYHPDGSKWPSNSYTGR